MAASRRLASVSQAFTGHRFRYDASACSPRGVVVCHCLARSGGDGGGVVVSQGPGRARVPGRCRGRRLLWPDTPRIRTCRRVGRRGPARGRGGHADRDRAPGARRHIDPPGHLARPCLRQDSVRRAAGAPGGRTSASRGPVSQSPLGGRKGAALPPRRRGARQGHRAGRAGTRRRPSHACGGG